MIVAPLGARGPHARSCSPPTLRRRTGSPGLAQMAGGADHRHEDLTEGRALPRPDEPHELPPEEPMAADRPVGLP